MLENITAQTFQDVPASARGPDLAEVDRVVAETAADLAGRQGGDGEWCFERRRFHRWYIGDALTRPAVGLGVSDRSDGLTTTLLPEGFAKLASFWGG